MLLPNMKADLHEKKDPPQRIMQEQLEAQGRELTNDVNEERPRARVIHRSSWFAGLSARTSPGPSALESTKSTRCPMLGSDGKGETATFAENKAWAFVPGLGMRRIL